MEGHSTRFGSVEIELRNIGTVHLKLPVNDIKQLMEFIKGISAGSRPPGIGGRENVQIKSVGVDGEGPSLKPDDKVELLPPSPNGEAGISQRREAIEGRIEDLEGKIANLIDMNKQLIESLNPENENKEPKIPSAGTKYHDVLQELVQRYGNNTFEGNQVTEDRRHVLSILNNKYNALEVVETRGRTNIYKIRKEIMQRIISNDGTSNLVEIRGKDRKSCDAFLETNQKRYPGFTFAFLEGNGLRQRYRLFFKDNAVQLSVTANLSRFVGSKTNLIVREA